MPLLIYYLSSRPDSPAVHNFKALRVKSVVKHPHQSHESPGSFVTGSLAQSKTVIYKNIMTFTCTLLESAAAFGHTRAIADDVQKSYRALSWEISKSSWKTYFSAYGGAI